MQVMVVLVSTGRIQVVEVMLVDSIITEFYSINIILATSERYLPITEILAMGLCSKCNVTINIWQVGMRTFHYKRNAHFCPSINVDRLWSMVPEGVYEKAKTDSNMAPVIDVTKLVSRN